MTSPTTAPALGASAQAPGEGARGPRRWWRGRWLFLLLAALALFAGRGWILWALALPLIGEGQPSGADYLLVVEGDCLFDRAARIYHSGDSRDLLVVRRSPQRLQRMGILPTTDALARRELVARGVPEDRIAVLPGEVITDWEMARQLGHWLAEHTDARVCLVCDRFDGRRMKYIVRSVLSEAESGRVGFLLLPHRWYDETNWWKGKRGWLALLGGYLRLGYTSLIGEDRDEWREWDVDRYSRELP